MNEIKSKIILLILTSSQLFIICRLWSLLPTLRPGKDDYCFASDISHMGIFDSITNFFLNWTGNIVGITIILLLVGLPLTTFSWPFASLIPITVSLGSVIALYYSIISREKRNDSTLLIKNLNNVILLITGILTFFFLFYDKNIENYDYSNRTINIPNINLISDLGDSIFMWQNISVGYILIPTLASILGLIIFSRSNYVQNNKIFIVLASFLIGMLDFITATVFLIVSSVHVFGKMREISLSKRIQILFVPLISTFTGMVLSYLAPGTQIRIKHLDRSNFSDLILKVPEILARGAYDLILLISNPSNFIPLMVGFLILWSLEITSNKVIRHTLFYLIILLLSEVFVNAFAEYFSYYANWHRLPQYLLSYFIWVTIGGLMANNLKNPKSNGSSIRDFSIPTFSCVLLFCVSSLLATNNLDYALKNRLQSWNLGIRYHAISDLETDWINACWQNMGKKRV